MWFGILGLVAGFAVLFSGVLTAEPAPQASDTGITITVLHSAASN
jgi:hypothetical protein